MDEAYLVMLFVTLEQERSIRALFKAREWLYRGKEFSSCTMESAKGVFQSGIETHVGNPSTGEFYTVFVALLKEFLVSLECNQNNVLISKSNKTNKAEHSKIPKISSVKKSKSSGCKKLKASAKNKRSCASNKSKNKLEKMHKLKQAWNKVSTVFHNSETYTVRTKPSQIQNAEANQTPKRSQKLTKSNVFDAQIKTKKEREEENSEHQKTDPFSSEQNGVDQNDSHMKSVLNVDDCCSTITFVNDSDFPGVPCIQSTSSCVEIDCLSTHLENSVEDEVAKSSIKVNSKEEKSNRGSKRQSKVSNSIKFRDSILDEVESAILNIDSKQKSDISCMNQTRRLSKKGKYDCSECQGTFMFFSKYQNHKRDGKCKFDCSVCGKSFTSRNWSTYQAHLRWHKNERPFKCNL
ncbi:hypothetical protein CHS0354_007717, partial [Potamilus streckersoni]